MSFVYRDTGTHTGGVIGMNSVKVIIAGEQLELRSDDSEEFILRVARYLDRKMTELKREKKIIGYSSFHKELLIALNIAEDLLKEVEQGERLKSEHAQMLTLYNRMRDEFEMVERAERMAKQQMNELAERVAVADAEVRRLRGEAEALILENSSLSRNDLEAEVQLAKATDTNRRLQRELEKAKSEVEQAQRELEARAEEYGNVSKLRRNT